ncbi:MAG TPA: ATP-dependent DNA ligase [Terriglobales bacterium]|nr:ATP-dependent DNA ligase [Terriglobales bacterium]
MQQLAELCEAVAGTSRKTEKVRLVAAYLRSRGLGDAAVSAVFLSGRPFPAHEETTLNLGGRQLWRVIAQLARKSDAAMTAAYRKHGDLGSAACEVLQARAKKKSDVNVSDVANYFRQIAKARGPAAKSALAAELLSKATPLEAKHIVKIITSELRIGLKESLVEEAIALAYDAPLAQVQRANMLLGDIGETLRLATRDALRQAQMRLFHPIGLMLASPAENADEAFTEFSEAQVEDKYDGIRAQAHVGAQAPRVRLFSRTRDEITESFPELAPALRAFRGELILDGEIVAWREGRALPFSELQKRLGRKKPTHTLMDEVPVAYLVFDVLYTEGEMVIDRPLRERGIMLDAAFADASPVIAAEATDAQGQLLFEPAAPSDTPKAEPRVIRAPTHRATSSQELEAMFERAQAGGNEGLMVKDVNSPYVPGRRGRSWLKLKRELATLDVVVTQAEWGHGKRAGVLSDVTFAVRSGERLLNVGKAYSGLTDEEIAELTQWFLEHTLEDRGFVRQVEPKIVLEVAFNAVMRSDRHDSGYALRFPRILRIRGDKSAEEIDTLETVRGIYERQRLAKSA